MSLNYPPQHSKFNRRKMAGGTRGATSTRCRETYLSPVSNVSVSETYLNQASNMPYTYLGRDSNVP